MMPHPCSRDLTGLTYDYMMIVRRAEAMRPFVYWDPTDGMEYVGTLRGKTFPLLPANGGRSFPNPLGERWASRGHLDGARVGGARMTAARSRRRKSSLTSTSRQASRSMFVIAGPPPPRPSEVRWMTEDTRF